jgi:hypothetical protein
VLGVRQLEHQNKPSIYASRIQVDINMSDIEIRVKRSLRAVMDSHNPGHKRYVKAIKAFQGLDLGAITKETRSLLESSLVKSNAILENYELATFADYKSISSEDLNILIQNQIKLCNELKAMSHA